MIHYICTGECKGVSEKPGMCKAPECTLFQEPLEPCDCTEEEHDPHPERSDEDIEKKEKEDGE